MSTAAVVASHHNARLERPPDMMMEDLESLRAQSPLMRPKELTSYLLCKYELEDICSMVRADLRAQGLQARQVTEARAHRTCHLIHQFIESELVRISRDQSTPQNFKGQVIHLVRDPGVSERNVIREFEQSNDGLDLVDFRLWLVDYVQAAAAVIVEQERRIQAERLDDFDKLGLVQEHFLREVLGRSCILGMHNDDDQVELRGQMSLFQIEAEDLLPNFRGNSITLIGPEGEHYGGFLDKMDLAERARVHDLALQEDRRDELAIMRSNLPESLEERYEFLIDRQGNIKKGREEILSGAPKFRLAAARALVEQYKTAGFLNSTDPVSIIDEAIAYHELRFRMDQIKIEEEISGKSSEQLRIERIAAEAGLSQTRSQRFAEMKENHHALLECLRENKGSLEQYLS